MLNRFRADPLHPVTEKECIFILNAVYRAHLQIFCQSIPAGLVEIKNALFIALAGYMDNLIIMNIGKIQPHQFRKTHPTIKKKGDHTIITFFVFTINMLQKTDALVKC